MALDTARAPKGTTDMLPAAARAWEYLTRTASDIFSRYGYEPVYTPVFEHTEVFVRGIGEATDIVGKEMYTFLDKGNPPRSLTLRPEGTASIVRAALEHNLTANGQGAKLYYNGPMFRYERPQKGRQRQFWQIGAEALGMAEPTADAEVIAMLMEFFAAVGIPASNMRLLLNTMGDENCRPVYRDKIAAFIRSHSADLCEECVRRADTNPLRAFDCKNPGCRVVMADAPLLRDELCDECAAHYAAVKGLLDGLGVAYEEDPTLVRGLDYYTRTVFEIQADGLGSQNAIGGGGRYDRLMEAYGGPPTPGLGFALGFERTVLALDAAGVSVPAPAMAEVFVARVAPEVTDAVFALTARLRGAGVAAEMDHQARSLKSQMKLADRLGARYVVVIGPDEVAAGEAVVRDMSSASEERAPIEALPELLAARLA
ncbi:MAG: histidine--tRNA ligase [Coriobacteriia bacterium]|nr:histidine--tRNA ligase [Coriobacteriia bacterium]